MLPLFPLGSPLGPFGLGGLPGNTTDAPRESEFLEDGVSKIYPMLIKPIRDLDRTEGKLLVKRFLQRPETNWAATLARVRALKDTDKPETCREDLLQYLKDQVGFTSELDFITTRLDTDTLRKLIKVAVPLWNKRGTEEGIAEWIRLLTGRAVVFNDWFDFRWILGETQVGFDQQGNDSWLIGGEVTTFDEFTSNLHVMDAGNLDRQLLLDLVQLSRPASERIEVILADFIDFFDQGRALWTNRAAPVGTVSGEAFLLHPGTIEEAIISVTASTPFTDPSLFSYSSFQRFKAPAGNTHRTVWSKVSTAGYTTSYFQLDLNVRVTGQNEVKLTYVPPAGASSVLYDGAVGPFLFAPDVFYSVRIQTFYRVVASLGGGLYTLRQYIKIYLDECLVVNTSADAIVATSGTTGVAFQIAGPPANTADTTVDNVEVVRHPLRLAKVAPSGITTSDNFFT